MTNDQTSATDPLGTEVRLPVQEPYTNFDRIELLAVIERPAMIIETTGPATKTRYYFRSLSWTTTLLLTAQKNGKGWEVCNLVENPDTDLLARLLNEGIAIFRK